MRAMTAKAPTTIPAMAPAGIPPLPEDPEPESAAPTVAEEVGEVLGVDDTWEFDDCRHEVLDPASTVKRSVCAIVPN